MTNGDHENSQESQPGNSQAENMDVTVPPQVPESETSESNESATGQLASMLDTDFDPSQHEEEHVELEADKKNAKIDWTVTGIAGVLVAAVVVWGLALPDNFAPVSDRCLPIVTDNFGRAFDLLATDCVVVVVPIAASPCGAIHLGAISQARRVSPVSWLSMALAAGRGSGFVFYGAAEPLAFYRD